MIIVNKHADYSAVSIGTVDIPIDYREETLALLAKYSKQLSIHQKNAVDKFVDSLVEVGIWERLENLYMPMLASTPSEALYNYIQDIQHTVAQDNDYYEMGTYGIKTNKNGTNKTGVPVESTATRKNVTFGGFRMIPGLTNLPAKYLLCDNMTAEYLYNGFGVFINNVSYPSSQVALDTNADRNLVLGQRKIDTSATFYTANYTRMANGVVLDAFPDTWDGTNFKWPQYKDLQICWYNEANDCGGNEGLIALQLEEATDSEMLVINNAIKKLIDDFCVTP